MKAGLSIMSQTTDLHIEVLTQYVAEESNPTLSQYLFAYTINIRNMGPVAAQIISRHWIIEDGNNNEQTVSGLGVVGQQPLIRAGEVFEYTSACPLSTPFGTMRGSYHCVGENGVPFDVEIPLFVLSLPEKLH